MNRIKEVKLTPEEERRALDAKAAYYRERRRKNKEAARNNELLYWLRKAEKSSPTQIALETETEKALESFQKNGGNE